MSGNFKALEGNLRMALNGAKSSKNESRSDISNLAVGFNPRKAKKIS